MATKKKTEHREIKQALRKFKWIHAHGEEIVEAETVIAAKVKCHDIAAQKGWHYKRVFRDFYEVTP